MVWKDREGETVSRIINWQRILIRSGFVFKKTNSSFDFSYETKENHEFLAAVLNELNLSKNMEGFLFKPPNKEFDQHIWLQAIDKLHIGCGALVNYNDLGDNSERISAQSLIIMDTYLAGIIRWVNEIGLITWCSCDGHDRKLPHIYFKYPDDVRIFNACLRAISIDNKWSFIVSKEPLREKRDKGIIRNKGYRLGDDKIWLLDIAEELFNKRNEIIEFIDKIKHRWNIVNKNI